MKQRRRIVNVEIYCRGCGGRFKVKRPQNQADWPFLCEPCRGIDRPEQPKPRGKA